MNFDSGDSVSVQKQHESLMNHIVLPRFLPQCKSDNFHQVELELLMRMVENVASFGDIIPGRTMNVLRCLATIHRNRTPKTISDEINKLTPGDTFAMFIRRRNTAIMIRMNDAENVIVATFPGKLSHHVIYANNSDVELDYPAQAIKVEYSEMIRSEEFANQLCLLYDLEFHGDKGSDYIRKWLPTVLMNEQSRTASEHEFPVIKKKICDEILGEVKNHFRRSSFYMVVKVILQHSLAHELGNATAKYLYKIIMLRFLTRQCDFFNGPACKTLNIELTEHTLAKLARRIEKLSYMTPQSQNDQLDELKKNAVDIALHSIHECRLKIECQIKNLHEENTNQSMLETLCKLNFGNDVSQKVPRLRRHLEQRSNGQIDNCEPQALQVKTYSRLYMNSFKSPLIAASNVGDQNSNIFAMSDFENLILYETELNDKRYTSDELRSWCFNYTSRAVGFYDDDRLGVSKCVLVLLKMLAILDSIATEAHPLLLEHHSGIDTKIIDYLLLPQLIDMQIALELQTYFNQRNAKSSDPSLIGESWVTVKSFSSKFAARSEEMQVLRAEIQRMIERKIQEKKYEWTRQRQEVESLRSRARMLSHEYYKSCYYAGFHKSNCDRCSLEHRANNIKIYVYERALPDNTYEQNAVVFELKIPLEVACLRDALHNFVKYCNKNSGGKLNHKGNWINYSQIKNYDCSKSQFVHLGSTSASVDQCQQYHVDNDFFTFNLANGYNCTFHESGSQLLSTINLSTIKQRCTMATQGEYSCLQWALNTTLHSQNMVLTNQSDCPINLRLQEFKDFGSLRADGHRLQWRKLYAMISCEALSFESPSVMSLVMQTIWETGISGDAGAIRESHNEMNYIQFSRKMIQLLSQFVKKQRNNWMHPLKLLLPTLIAIRVFELNDDETLADRIAVVLNEIRTVALEWIQKIQQAIKDLHDPSPSDESNLREKLIFVTVSGALTFAIHSHHRFVGKIFLNNKEIECSAPRIWLEFIIALNNNLILNNCETKQLPMHLKTLVRSVRNAGIHIEPTIRNMIERNPSDIHALIKKHWTRANKGRFEKLYFYPECPQVLVVHVSLGGKTQFVTVDTITGSFLVNNLPICRLSDSITNSSIFKRIFEDFVFEVQPDDDNTYSTVQKYNNNIYEFSKTSNGLIITERCENGTEYELVPHEVLIGEIPELLIENHSHWWDKATHVIQFRPTLFRTKDFSMASGIEYTLDMSTCHLFHIKTRRNLLDVTSDSYLKIVQRLSRLERLRYIHILMDEPRVAKVELVRMQLKFKVDCSMHHDGPIDILSNEFNEMRVSQKQNIGTLCGLNHGLLLEHLQKSATIEHPNGQITTTQILLIPNGKVISKQHNTHVTVDIDINADLRKPPFHSYQVDEFCRQLKPKSNSFSAWFYLAYLHALTSHGEIEPFTGMSGTEQALMILQSRFVWSSSPYDSDSIEMLQQIGSLSPTRSISEGVQQIKWPAHIPPSSAQDSFVFIVDKLLSDSNRLRKLYKSIEAKIIGKTDFNIRDYHRCLPFTPNLRISDEFIEHKKLTTSHSTVPIVHFSKDTHKVSLSYHKKSYYLERNISFKQYVMQSSNEISGPIHTDHIQSYLNHDVTQSFDDLWISFYEVVRQRKLNEKQLALIWSVLAHDGHHIDSILALQAISMSLERVAWPDPPNIMHYLLHKGTFNKSTVNSICETHHTQDSDYYSDNWDADDRKRYNKRIKNAITDLTETVTAAWPCNSVTLTRHSNINTSAAEKEINVLLKLWNNNRKLGIFLDEVTAKLQTLSKTIIYFPDIVPYAHLNAKNWPKFEIDFKSKLIQSLNEDVIKQAITEAESDWKTGGASSNKSANDWWTIYDCILSPNHSSHLVDAGMCARSVPSLVLPQLLSENTDIRLKMIIGALALMIAKEQRIVRINTYARLPQLKPAHDREIENEAHINWKPSDYPEWLIFEIEQNLTIRRIQIEIAKRMINPPDIGTKHSTMQLNMGEGKTAVIVPILASILADGNQACQITVLKSLFATNLKSLRRYLGGMLGRKVYVFPCRRDMDIHECVSQIESIYEECKREKGVILTLPEYRLSFQLKVYETIKKGKIDEAQQFLNIHKWMNANVRSILDESDAILHAKYQLIYTVGQQMQIDGGSQRWLVPQALLKRVPLHMKELLEEYGEEKLEFNTDYVQNGHVYGAEKGVDYRDDVFTPCRILDTSIYPLLKNALIDDFIEGRMDITFPEVVAARKQGLRHLMSATTIDEKTFESTLESLGVTERNIVLTLCGLLRFEVLRLILTKRWRVSYGVDTNGTKQMAVPFKAKDVAAELTEFGHPDVAICLTQLSYYYSGLNDKQLCQSFQLLANIPNASEIYEKWVTSISPKLIDASIRSYSGINLSDPFQREEILFPLFRFNMHIIDFYLSNVVYPREAKAFESKLICTAWDLCSEHMEHRVTGFSGTNDTKNLLPLPIAQNDLEELESTNANVRLTLLQPENQAYQKLITNVTAKEIIEALVSSEIPVLLDSGALMLELNNKQVAEVWLKMAPDTYYDAAVYFDSKDVLQSIDRNGLVTEFDCSVYRENLTRCLVYLDDTHTRGTDLKFPLSWNACVTLSGDITRDKTVQACMRMRQLGKGHSIAFWASFEADIRIRETCDLSQYDEVTNENVIDFICANSKTFERENTVHWASAGHNYAQKLAAHKLYEDSGDAASLKCLYEKCEDNEFVTLNEMYGDKETALLTDISQNKFSTLVKPYENHSQIKQFVEKIDEDIVEKLQKQAPDVERFVHCLDEEQEKELEQEVEEERQVERPPKLNPATPLLDERLKILISTGTTSYVYDQLKAEGKIISFAAGLVGTKLFEEYKDDASNWADHLFVTQDFVRVLANTNHSSDQYLRPVWWFARIGQSNNNYVLLMLSSYECDRLLTTFRKSSESTLHMFRPTMSKWHSDLVNEKDLWVTNMKNAANVDVGDSSQIKMFSGSTYLKSDAEQNAYCNFMGIIPRPRTEEQNRAFEQEIIEPNGFVPVEHRNHSAVKESVKECRFQRNPVVLAIKLIEAHHEFMRKESNVSSILESGAKLQINKRNANWR